MHVGIISFMYNFVGVTVWEILTFGARPYPGIKAQELLGSIYNGVRLQQPETCSRDLYNELLKCELNVFYTIYNRV